MATHDTGAAGRGRSRTRKDTGGCAAGGKDASVAAAAAGWTAEGSSDKVTQRNDAGERRAVGRASGARGGGGNRRGASPGAWGLSARGKHSSRERTKSNTRAPSARSESGPCGGIAITIVLHSDGTHVSIAVYWRPPASGKPVTTLSPTGVGIPVVPNASIIDSGLAPD